MCGLLGRSDGGVDANIDCGVALIPGGSSVIMLDPGGMPQAVSNATITSSTTLSQINLFLFCFTPGLIMTIPPPVYEEDRKPPASPSFVFPQALLTLAMDIIFGVIAGPLDILILMTLETGKVQGYEVIGAFAVKHTGVGVGIDAEEVGLYIPLIGAEALG